MDSRRKFSSVSKEKGCTPICRCRVLYLGSAVPHMTKDGLQGIQEPLRELYPEKGAVGAKGIDSWLSVWSNGLLLENVDENHKRVTRFFPIETLHYCAAVRYVRVTSGTGGPDEMDGEKEARFLPLDSPFARMPNAAHPPLFAAILRRTTGIKVLECHAFICKREAAANALVRCCFHAYADSAYARQLEENEGENGDSASVAEAYVALDSIEKVQEWRSSHNGHNGSAAPLNGDYDTISAYAGTAKQTGTMSKAPSRTGTVRSAKSFVGSIFGGKSSKPRQMIIPDTPPPPPPPVTEDKKKKKGKKAMDDTSVIYHQPAHPVSGGLRRPVSITNLSSADSVIMNSVRPTAHANGYGPPPLMPPGPGMWPGPGQMPGPYLVPLPHPSTVKKSKKFGTFSGRGKKSKTPQPMMLMPPPLIGPMVPPPNYPHYALPYPGTMTLQRPGTRMSAIEEPIYMPGMARPTSPEASYQPSNYPHDEYLQQQTYSTTLERSKLMRKKRLGRDPVDKEEDTVDAGVYRKGYLNEKAFARSIRQEHRSRSYGSLASLHVNGEGSFREDDKKERELRQLVHELDLSSDELERIEVSPEVYKQVRSIRTQQR
ncbi:uncharacterized protein LOC136027878 [Artemia franciscana]|uniref:PID domain-containing protein n=1 Tax=Artemia franciscana TaxID=6661 RepID=A0AA88HGK9_ARTSF|nr:hypothetical protein QYM36_014223 [Artemia franciscana]